VREAVTVWAAVILGLAVLQGIGMAVPLVQSVVGAAAVAAFLYAPSRLLEKRGQDPHDAGWRFDNLRQDVLWGLGACLLVLPIFTLGFLAFTTWLDKMPADIRLLLAPYTGHARKLQLHVPLTWDFLGLVAGNAAVAFAEEFFYRGYMTLRLGERFSPVRTAVAVAGLFAVGHLLTPTPWRLAVFFPALLFAFLRWRTGTVVGAAICHWSCNVWLAILEHSVY
jgi:membrane protease YdiL (CAAX protease family)